MKYFQDFRVDPLGEYQRLETGSMWNQLSMVLSGERGGEGEEEGEEEGERRGEEGERGGRHTIIILPLTIQRRTVYMNTHAHTPMHTQPVVSNVPGTKTKFSDAIVDTSLCFGFVTYVVVVFSYNNTDVYLFSSLLRVFGFIIPFLHFNIFLSHWPELACHLCDKLCTYTHARTHVCTYAHTHTLTHTHTHLNEQLPAIVECAEEPGRLMVHAALLAPRQVLRENGHKL